MARPTGRKKTELPSVSCVMAQPFLAAALAQGLPAERFLAPTGLSLSDIQKGEAIMAGQHWYDLLEDIARALGNPYLAYETGAQTAYDALPNLRILRRDGATLGELLTSLVIDVARISSMATYSLETDGLQARLITKRTFFPASVPGQADAYFFGFMERLLKSCCGREWEPRQFKSWIGRPNAVPAQSRQTVHVRRGDRAGARFEFPAFWMLLRFGGEQSQDLPAGDQVERGFLEAVRGLLELHLDKEKLTLERLAEITSQSPSSLKRSFVRHGTTFQAELEACRSARARALLLNSDLSLKEVAASIGFSGLPSFSRSFKRWTGQTPGAYRNGASLG